MMLLTSFTSKDEDIFKAEEYMKSHTSKNGSLADEIVNMSPEAKAILLNDVLNKKY